MYYFYMVFMSRSQLQQTSYFFFHLNWVESVGSRARARAHSPVQLQGDEIKAWSTHLCFTSPVHSPSFSRAKKFTLLAFHSLLIVCVWACVCARARVREALVTWDAGSEVCALGSGCGTFLSSLPSKQAHHAVYTTTASFFSTILLRKCVFNLKNP